LVSNGREKLPEVKKIVGRTRGFKSLLRLGGND
jgi:hypothetical protein